ncbi:MAG: hypothetical protein OXL96_20765 [Candidatus Poribacteria bacterium]|nr:hypothetical protein [Candidatus Poribacteria bacterium]
MKKFIVPICLVLLIGVASLWYLGGFTENTKPPQIDLSPKSTETEGIEQYNPLDALDTSQLDASQKEILTLLKQMGQTSPEDKDTVLETSAKIRTWGENLLKKGTAETIKHLKTLSLEEQTAYFKRMETRLYNNPRGKQREVRSPGSLDESWNRRLQRFIDAGYTLPNGIDLK